MQQALSEPQARKQRSRAAAADLSLKDFQQSAQRNKTQQTEHSERAVLDWREALEQAQKLNHTGSLEETALTDTFGWASICWLIPLGIMFSKN